MPIDKEKNILFIHIPKCGGSSIEKSLGYSHTNMLFGLYNHNNITYQLQHLTPQEIMDLGFMTKEDIEGYNTFCFIRNTYSKIVSSYISYFNEFTNSFEEYIDIVAGIADKHNTQGISLQTIETWTKKDVYKKKNITPNIPLADCHFKPQNMYVYLEEGNIMDYIGNMNNYASDFNTMCNKYNISAHISHVHKSKQYNYKDFYTEMTRSIIDDVYRKDIELFEFSF